MPAPLATPVTRTLTGIAYRDAKVGVAVGHGGSFVRTEDGGATWQEVIVDEALALLRTSPDAGVRR